MENPTRSTALSLSIGLMLMTAGAGGCADRDGQEPAYEGCANDENWSTFQDYLVTSRIKDDAAKRPKWLAPMDGSTAPSSPPATFQWQPSALNTGTANGNVSCGKFQAQSLSRSVTSSALRPLHEAPISGSLYAVQFSVAGGESYSVLTTRQFTEIPGDRWQTWKGKRVSVTLYSAQFLTNDVVEGPFQAEALELSIAP